MRDPRKPAETVLWVHSMESEELCELPRAIWTSRTQKFIAAKPYCNNALLQSVGNPSTCLVSTRCVLEVASPGTMGTFEATMSLN